MMITIVSGLPRSGTSMMMKMLEKGGIEILTDNIRKRDEDNPKGYYEFEPVKKLKKGDDSWLPKAEGKAVKIISALLIYLPKNYQYKVIFMEREIEEIIKSQNEMLRRRGKPVDTSRDEDIKRRYQKHLKEIKEWLKNQTNFEVTYVSFNKTIKKPKAEIKKVNKFLEKELDVKKMTEVVDEKLYRQRKEE